MADLRFNQIPTTAVFVNADDYIPIDGTTSGTRKIIPANLTVGNSVTSSFSLTSGTSLSSSFSTFAELASSAISASWAPTSGTSATGSVTSVSVTPSNGVSGTVANSSTAPGITISLGNISPSQVTSSFNGPHSGSVFGTASFSVSASWAPGASVIPSGTVSASQQLTNGQGTAFTTVNNVTLGQITASVINVSQITGSTFGTSSWANNSISASWAPTSGTAATGSVTSVSIASSNGVSGTVVASTTNPAITVVLGNISPAQVTSSFNGPHTGSLFGTSSFAISASWAPSAGGALGNVLSDTITVSNTFTASNAVFNSNGIWTQSNANSFLTSQVDGIIQSATLSSFVIIYSGVISLPGGFLASSSYYLSDVTAGLLTTSIPSNSSSYAVKVLNTGISSVGYVSISQPSALAQINLTGDVTGVLPISNGGTGVSTGAVLSVAAGFPANGITIGGTAANPTVSNNSLVRLLLRQTFSTTNVVTAGNNVIDYTGSLAPVTLLLASASAYTPGSRVQIRDLSGGVTGSNTLTVNSSGTDTINGIAAPAAQVIGAAYGYLVLSSDGVSAWTVVGSPAQSALTDPGSNGLVVRTSFNTTTTASGTSWNIRPLTWYANTQGALTGVIANTITAVPTAAHPGRGCIQFDVTELTQARLVISIGAVASNATTTFSMKYYTASSDTITDYLPAGAAGTDVSVTVNTIANKCYTGTWVNLTSGAQADVFWSLFAIDTAAGGLNPDLCSAQIQFR